MEDSPTLDLVIRTGTVASTTNRYYITFEVVNTSGIVDTLFVITRSSDPQSSNYVYSRVASISDLRDLSTTSVTSDTSYRVSAVTIESTSLAILRDLKENVPVVVKSLLDSTAKAQGEILGIETTLTLQGDK
jgi:hypothetical protein